MFTGETSGSSSSIPSPESKPKVPLIKHALESMEVSLRSSASLSEDQSLKILSYDALLGFSASATFIIDNEDLLTEILLRLPPKSLLRFQSVCKRWFSIISNPSFRSLHCRRYPATPSYAPTALFLCRETEKIHQIDFVAFSEEDVNSIAFSEEDVNSMGTLTFRLRNFLSGKILGFHSCNGLCIIFHLNHGRREFVVYNPTTHQYRLIPPVDIMGSLENPKHPCYRRRRNCEVALNIVFDPSKSNHYKIVCAREYDYEYKDVYDFCLYASETGLWREIRGTVDESYKPLYFENGGVFWNGNLHWVSGDKSLLCLDLENECLKWAGLPISREEQLDFWYFGESAGHLYTIEANESQALLFDVYELEKDYSQWVLKYSVDLAPLAPLYPSLVDERNGWFRIFMPYFFVDEKDRKPRLLISAVGKVISYDIDRVIVKELIQSVDVYCSWINLPKFSWNDANPHFETLACV